MGLMLADTRVIIGAVSRRRHIYGVSLRLACCLSHFRRPVFVGSQHTSSCRLAGCRAECRRAACQAEMATDMNAGVGIIITTPDVAVT